VSLVPETWSEPDSRAGLLYELAWLVLAIVVFGALAHGEPVSVGVEITRQRLLLAAAVGGPLGVAIAYASTATGRGPSWWRAGRSRFVAIFAVVVGVQIGLTLAPTWTVLTVLATAVATVPARIAAYLLAR